MIRYVRPLLLLLAAIPLWAAGSVQQSLSQLGKTETWVVAFRWEGDSSTGAVPNTNAQLSNCCQGYIITQVQTVPLSPAPTAGYSVAINDAAGFDALDGAAASLSASTPESFAASSASPPIQGTFTLVISGQSVASAKGVVYVFMQKPGQFNALNLTRGLGNGASNSANWLTIANPPFVDARRYNYTAQSPGGSLSAGACSFTMRPVPTGLVTGGSVYLSGGTGSAEALTSVTVSGSTVSGTCANGHSGAWSVRSATAGFQEAVSSLSSGGLVYIPAGTYSVYAATNITSNSVVIQGAGMGSTVVSVSTGTYSPFTFTGPASWCGIYDMQITTTLGRAGGYAVSASSEVQFEASRLRITNMPNGVRINSGNSNVVRDVYVYENSADGIFVDGANGFALLIDRVVVGSSQPGLTRGFHFKNSGDTIVSNSHTLLCNVGLLVDPGSGETVASLELNSTYFDNSVAKGIYIAPATGGNVLRTRMNAVWATSTSAGRGLYIDHAFGGNVDGVQIVNGQFYDNWQEGVLVDANGGSTIKNVSITASHFTRNGRISSGTVPGAQFNASNFQFIGNTSGVADGFGGANTQSYGVVVFAPANDYYIVTNNNLLNNVLGGLLDSGGSNKVVANNLQ